jgi:hypothetical protein
VATFLDPSFRELSFVNDKRSRLERMKTIEASLFSMANDVKIEDICIYMRVSETFATTKKK